MARQIVTEIDIDAPPGEVWEVLTDFERYEEWNPFIGPIEGHVEPGARLRVVLHVGGRAHTLTPRVRVVEPGGRFAWLGHLGVPGLADGEHSFHLEALTDGRTRLHHRERFRGVLWPLLWSRVRADTEIAFRAMNEALRERVEHAVRA